MKTIEEKLRKTYKGKVHVDQNSVAFLSKILIHLWNMGLKQSISLLENNKKDGTKKASITPITFNFWLTGVRETIFTLTKGERVSLRDVSVDLSRQVLKQLAGSWQSYFQLRKNGDTEARPPQQKKEEWFQTMAWSSFIILVDEGRVLVPGYKKNHLEIELGEYLIEKIRGRKVAYLTLYKNHLDGDFWLSVVVTEPAPKQIEKPKLIRAIDLGAGDIAVSDSSGVEFLIPARRSDKHWMPRIAEVEKRVSSCIKGSRAYNRRMNARKKMHRKSGNQKDSYQRKLAHALVLGAEAIVIGKSKTRLGLAQSSGTPDQHFGAQNTGYLFRLMLYIKEKAAERGVPVIEIPDPKRKGGLEDSRNKFFATQELLALGCKNFELQMPNSFTENKFVFNQGKGGKKTKKPT